MAYDFNGSNQYLSLATEPVTAVPLTMAAWGYADNGLFGADGEWVILNLSDTDARPEFTIEFGRDGGVTNILAMVFAASGGFAISATNPVVDTWYHVGGVFTSATSRTVYVNGVADGSDTTNLTPTGISDLYVGSRFDLSVQQKKLNGKVAEAAIWNVALTAAEMAILGRGYSPLFVRPESLVFYAPLVRGLQEYIAGTSLTNNNTATVFIHPSIIYPSPAQIRRFGTAVAPPTVEFLSRLSLLGVG